MKRNKAKVYEMYLDGIYQATGSTRVLADHIEVSRQTLEQYLHQGNNKGYTFEHIGNYAQIYALYNKEEFMMTGNIDQLSAATGMQIKQLEWFRTQTSEKRGGNYQVIKIEGDFEVINKTQKLRERIYEFKRGTDIHTGTMKELTELTGIAHNNMHLYTKLIGIRHAKIRAEDKVTGEVTYGTVDELADVVGVAPSSLRGILSNRRGRGRYHEFKRTGQYIVELIDVDKHIVTKKQVYVKAKPAHSKPVPMSDYGKELLEWSTRHLRRDA